MQLPYGHLPPLPTNEHAQEPHPAVRSASRRVKAAQPSSPPSPRGGRLWGSGKQRRHRPAAPRCSPPRGGTHGAARLWGCVPPPPVQTAGRTQQNSSGFRAAGLEAVHRDEVSALALRDFCTELFQGREVPGLHGTDCSPLSVTSGTRPAK